MTAGRDLTLGDYFERVVCMVRELRRAGLRSPVHDGTPLDRIVNAIALADLIGFDLREAMRGWIARMAEDPAHKGKWRGADGLPADPRRGT